MHRSKISIIFGAGGQDGYFLTVELIKLNHKIILVSNSKVNLKNKKIEDNKNTKIIKGNYLSEKFYINLIRKYKPDNLFFFYGITDPKVSFQRAKEFLNVNIISFSCLLRACSLCKFKKKIIYANSSEIFSNNKNLIDEKTKMRPNSIYGISKFYNSYLIKYYTQVYNLKILNIIFFNHDSKLRKKKYLTKQIVNQLLLQKNAKIKKIHILNKLTIRSWGNAEEYMRALVKLVNKNVLGDFIFSNSNIMSVEDLTYKIGKELNIEKRSIKVISEKLYADTKIPNNRKLLKNIGVNFFSRKILK